MPHNPLEPLFRRLSSVADLRDSGAAVLSTLPHRLVNLDAGHELYAAGSKDLPCYILVEGCAARSKLRTDGSRAIVGFELSGDMINPEGLLLGRADCGARISAPSIVAIVERDAMARAREADRNLETALWRYTLVKAAALEEWLLNVGRRSPTGRLAHLLLELHLRLVVVGTSKEYASRLHASPQDLADAMGLQQVIVTRCLQELALQQAIALTEGLTVVLDADRLAKIGDFRADYLHLAS